MEIPDILLPTKPALCHPKWSYSVSDLNTFKPLNVSCVLLQECKFLLFLIYGFSSSVRSAHMWFLGTEKGDGWLITASDSARDICMSYSVDVV